ncbi:hypothetical protein ACEXQE_08290 [Herbiconiux sp. P17]|uniref:hypothetical protein n=1 Tax=Herbiconiux wuyangfengii TaxID=3342794 RepID=UPI0035BB91DD
MIKPEFVSLATDASYASLDLTTISTGDLLGLRDTVEEIWVRLDVNEDLAIRFEWLMPLIDLELRKRVI